LPNGADVHSEPSLTIGARAGGRTR
jgi:hypothetical protein